MKKPSKIISSKIILQHKPILDKADANAIKKVVESGWISEGPETKNLKKILESLLEQNMPFLQLVERPLFFWHY